MQFLKYMEHCKGDPRVYARIDGQMTFWHDDGIMRIRCDPSLNRVLADATFFEVMEFYLTCKVYGGGPKVFRPTSEQLRLLHEMTLNVPYSEYAQPFPTVVIEYPDGFSDTHVVPNMPENSSAPTQRPLFSIVHHEGPYLVHSLYMDSHTTMKAWWHADDTGLEVEDWLQPGALSLDRRESTVDWSQVEQDLECECRRIALAYCLLLDEVGVKKRGPVQPARYDAWRRSAEKRPELGTHDSMRTHPFYYELKQEVVLHRTVEHHTELSESGRTMPPHHRRGHYRMQHHGPSNSLTKRVRIPPVFVNKHLFLGSMADAAATYRS